MREAIDGTFIIERRCQKPSGRRDVRIALCLHGVVGYLYTDKRRRRWCGDVDYRIGLEHYRQHLFADNPDVDVFIHSWSTQYEEQLVRDYQPKRQLFQTQMDFGKDTTALNFLKSRWYSTKAVVDLKRAHEQKTGVTYDWVMLSRFDLALLKVLDFTQYDPQMFYAAKHGPSGSQENDGFCDLFFYANSHNIDRFASLYDVWEDYKIFDAHEEARFHALKLGLSIGYDFLRGEDFELVRGIYEDCQYAGDEFRGIDSLTKVAEYPEYRFKK